MPPTPRARGTAMEAADGHGHGHSSPRGHSPSPARHGQQPPVGRAAPPTNQKPTNRGEMLPRFHAREGRKLRVGVALVQSNSTAAAVTNVIPAPRRGFKA